MKIRAVQPEEASAWVAMRQCLWPHHTVDDLSGTVEAYFSTGTPLVAAAFLAWDGVRPIGFVELSVRPYVPGARSLPAPHVEGWYVEPAFRSQGIGRRLIVAAEKWAIRNGHSQLGSDALLENTGGAAAHRALGFQEVERVCFFVKDLDREAAT